MGPDVEGDLEGAGTPLTVRPILPGTGAGRWMGPRAPRARGLARVRELVAPLRRGVRDVQWTDGAAGPSRGGGGTAALLCVASAGLLVPAFPPFGLRWLAFVALVPLMVALHGRRVGPAALLGFLFGTVFVSGAGHWISALEGFRWFHFVALAVYLGAYYAAFGALLRATARAGLPFVIAAPALWVSLEYLRSNAGPLAHPWALLAHTQSGNLPVIQVSSIGGVYAVSFLVVMVNAAVAQAILERRWGRPLWAAFAIVLAVAGYGWLELANGSPGRAMPVTVIQPNIPQDLKWDPARVDEHLATHVALTRRAAAEGPSALVVWPESSVEGDVTRTPSLRAPLVALAREIGRPVLFGSDRRPMRGLKPVMVTGPSGETIRAFRPVFAAAAANSAYLVWPRGLDGAPYDKQRLLPFGEYQPWPWLPWPDAWRRDTPDYAPGRRDVLFDVAGDGGTARFAVLICWESMYPEIARGAVRRGADFLVNISNDAWVPTAAARQFLAMTVFRAVENRTALVRAANSGISAFVDPYGRILGRVTDGGRDTFVGGYLTRPVPLGGGRTLYTTFGDLFAYACLTLSAVSVALAAARGLRTWAKPRSD
jgi:apolipoprotein N-acyltransferase